MVLANESKRMPIVDAAADVGASERLTDGAPANTEIEASAGLKTKGAHRATNTMTPVNGTKRDREANRRALGIVRSFQN